MGLQAGLVEARKLSIFPGGSRLSGLQAIARGNRLQHVSRTSTSQGAAFEALLAGLSLYRRISHADRGRFAAVPLPEESARGPRFSDRGDRLWRPRAAPRRPRRAGVRAAGRARREAPQARRRARAASPPGRVRPTGRPDGDLCSLGALRPRARRGAPPGERPRPRTAGGARLEPRRARPPPPPPSPRPGALPAPSPA